MKRTKKAMATVIIVTIILFAITISSKPVIITIPAENGGYKLEIIGQNVSINGGKTIHNVTQIGKTPSDKLVISKERFSLKPIIISVPSKNGGYNIEIMGNDVSINGGKKICNVKQIGQTSSGELIILRRNGELIMKLMEEKRKEKSFLLFTNVKKIITVAE